MIQTALVPERTAEAPPTSVRIGETSPAIARLIRVVDAATGELLPKVIEADAIAGRVRRFRIEDGAFVLENDRFAVIEEDRAIRIEWAADGEDASL